MISNLHSAFKTWRLSQLSRAQIFHLDQEPVFAATIALHANQGKFAFELAAVSVAAYWVWRAWREVR
jgi:hypothetical protein